MCIRDSVKAEPVGAQPLVQQQVHQILDIVGHLLDLSGEQGPQQMCIRDSPAGARHRPGSHGGAGGAVAEGAVGRGAGPAPVSYTHLSSSDSSLRSRSLARWSQVCTVDGLA